MGTRHLICAVVDGEIKLAQYGQWDGYPEGQGKTVCAFIKRITEEPRAFSTFVENLRACSFLTDDEIKAVGDEVNGKESTNLQTGEPQWGEWQHLSRDNGAKILNIVLERGPLKLQDYRHFAGESLFCEYAYVLDMDNLQLEFYTGFNKTGVQPGNRFSGMPHEGEYYPVMLRGIIKFSEEPTYQMLEMLQPEEKEDA